MAKPLDLNTVNDERVRAMATARAEHILDQKRVPRDLDLLEKQLNEMDDGDETNKAGTLLVRIDRASDERTRTLILERMEEGNPPFNKKKLLASLRKSDERSTGLSRMASIGLALERISKSNSKHAKAAAVLLEKLEELEIQAHEKRDAEMLAEKSHPPSAQEKEKRIRADRKAIQKEVREAFPELRDAIDAKIAAINIGQVTTQTPQELFELNQECDTAIAHKIPGAKECKAAIAGVLKSVEEKLAAQDAPTHVIGQLRRLMHEGKEGGAPKLKLGHKMDETVNPEDQRKAAALRHARKKPKEKSEKGGGGKCH